MLSARTASPCTEAVLRYILLPRGVVARWTGVLLAVNDKLTAQPVSARYVHGGSAFAISPGSNRLSASASQLGRGRIVAADIEHDPQLVSRGLCCIHFVFSHHRSI